MASTEERELLRARLLGRGLACVPVEELTRDLVLARNPDGTVDLALVSGVDNLTQSLAIAVTTPLGGDVFNTGFGFDGLNALADETSPLLVRERVRVGLVNLLRKDPRVARVVDVKLMDQRLETPSTGAARQLDVRVVFETVSGEQLTLNAGALGARSNHG